MLENQFIRDSFIRLENLNYRFFFGGGGGGVRVFCPWSHLNISFQQKMRKNNRFRNVYLKKNCHRINTCFKLNFWRKIRYFRGVFCTQEYDNPSCNAICAAL